MSSVQLLRDFISDRLTAAAADIFSEFEKTIVQYEEVIDRQRRLLDVAWKPEINLHRVRLPANVFKTETPSDQHQEILDGLQQDLAGLQGPLAGLQGPLAGLDPGQRPLKQETGAFMVIPGYEEGDLGGTASSGGEIFSHGFPPTDNDDQDSGSSEIAQLFPTRRNQARDDDGGGGGGPTPGDVHAHGGRLGASDEALDGGQRRTMQDGVQADRKACVCHICGKELKYPSHVRSHMRSHTGEKPYSCKLCGRSFSFSCNLRSHERSHTGEKPHFCRLCGTSFSRKWNLKSHMKVHAGEIPRSGGSGRSGRSRPRHACGERYSPRDASADRERAGDPFDCDTCGRYFGPGAGCEVQAS